MSRRILTGITTTGIPHIGNYFGAIKPALHLSCEKNVSSYFFLADLHAIIKQTNPNEIKVSVNEVALAWLSSGLDPEESFFYRQSNIPEITELAWILSCVTAKGLINRSHAYKAAVQLNHDHTKDEDKGISMGLFSYPVLMAADILMFNSSHVPVGKDQLQHLEITRDIAEKFNHQYGNTFVIPEAIINKDGKLLVGHDGRKMSKSYNNVIPFLSSEKELKKAISKIVTNSLEPGEPKDHSSCNLFSIYSAFASTESIAEMKEKYKNGIGWGDAKEYVFNELNSLIIPLREKYLELKNQPHYLDEVLALGAEKVRPQAKELLLKIKDLVGISSIS